MLSYANNPENALANPEIVSFHFLVLWFLDQTVYLYFRMQNKKPSAEEVDAEKKLQYQARIEYNVGKEFPRKGQRSKFECNERVGY